MQYCQKCCIDADRCLCEVTEKSFEEMKSGVLVCVTYFEGGHWFAKTYFFDMNDEVISSPDFIDSSLKAAEGKFNEQYKGKHWVHSVAFVVDVNHLKRI